MRITIDLFLLFFIIVGGLAGYFLNFWIQLIVIVVLFFWLSWASKNDNGTGAHADLWHLFFAGCIGTIMGNLIYYIPLVDFTFKINLPETTNWFIR